MKKEYLSATAKDFHKKSDTELIDFICDHNPIPGEGAKSILDKRMKMSLQHLTKVMQNNNDSTERYNAKLEKLTRYILFFTIVMAVTTVINGYLAYKQYKYAEITTEYTEMATRIDRIYQARSIQDAVKRCKENPESTSYGLYGTESGKEVSCAYVLKKYEN